MNNSQIDNVFKDCFLAYLDILGIKKSIIKIRKNPDKITDLINVYSFTNHIPKKGNKDTSHSGNIEFRSWFFSDTIVIMTEKNFDALPHLFLLVRYIHDRFIKEKFLLRGAIVLDSMYYGKNQNILLGKAIIKAYEIESKIAIYPRIVIEDSLYQCIKNGNYNFSNYPLSESKKILEFIKRDFDGIYYFDVLNKDILRKKDEKLECKDDKFHISWSQDAQNDESIYEEIERLLNENLCDKNKNNSRNNRSNKKILQKYNWLNSYYKKNLKK
jgi:hypothetical protein